jgi:hypothetical protein
MCKTKSESKVPMVMQYPSVLWIFHYFESSLSREVPSCKKHPALVPVRFWELERALVPSSKISGTGASSGSISSKISGTGARIWNLHLRKELDTELLSLQEQ